LRSIDTLINWFISDNEEMNETNLKALNLVLSNVEKLDLLIKGILDYSSIDKQQTDNRIIDLNLLVDEILTTIHVSEHVDVSKKTQLPQLLGNDFRFKQLFQNLIQNAINIMTKKNFNRNRAFRK
jgi:light-regulated signal transduction histidine kinase (bacteriophytochrome)